ncbi:MAG: ImmA/IrrE family metallo-endopeptidase [Gammaproteobacteria bacterium]|nr:ImmA/IrrE family metallo-endopeptidase [Gammaproteobacteria bacterium]
MKWGIGLVSLIAFCVEAQNLSIEVDDSWPAEIRQEVETILEETAEKIWEHLDPKPNYKIVVRYDSAGPMVLYREFSSLPDDTVEMLLNPDLSVSLYKPQLIFQFGHEFGHVIQEYNRLRSTESKNNWLHESLCELLAIWLLKEEGDGPIIDAIRARSIQLAEEIRDWEPFILATEELLRSNGYARKLNAMIAYKLYPAFKKNPKLFNAFRFLPKSDSELEKYFEEWADNAAKSLSDELVEEIKETLFQELQ